MRTVRFVMVLLATYSASIVCGNAFSEMTFVELETIDLSLRPDSAVAADFDGDGNMDLAATADLPDRIAVFLGGGDGTLEDPVDVLTGNGTSPGHLVAADFDDDGDTDIAVALKDDNDVTIFLNDGDAGFTEGDATTVGTEPSWIAIGDFDDDGDIDMVTANRDSNDVSILLNDGDGNFTNDADVAVGEEPRAVCAADLDDDGDVDLAVTNHDSRDVSILENDGDAVFTESSTLSVGTNLRPEGIVAADLDADDLPDLVVTTSDDTPPSNFASVYMNDGGLDFAARADYDVDGTEPGAIVTSDFDGDGDLDVATANKESNDVSVLTNDGEGVLEDPLLIDVGTAPDHLIATDLDGDGAMDLVVVNQDSDDFTLIENESVASEALFLRGDVNSNGSVSALIDALFLLQWQFSGGDTPLCMDAADVDDNGSVSALLDSLYLLRWAFSSGPAPTDPGVELCGADPDGIDDGVECVTPPDAC